MEKGGKYLRSIGQKAVRAMVAVMAMVVMGVGGAAALTASPAGAATNGGAEHITIIDNNGTGPVILSGFVTDTGRDVALNNNTDVFRLTRGTITVGHHSTVGGGTFTLNRTTCVATITDQGTFAVTNGTGAYTNLRGHGTYMVSGTVIFPLINGQCHPRDTQPSTVITIVRANGVLHYATGGA